MEFNNAQPIFIQIADWVIARILLGDYQAEMRIPSVRDLATELEVNPNTVVRSFERLQNEGIIYNERGIGYFVSPQALPTIKAQRRQRFLQETLPALFEEIDQLDISWESITDSYQTYVQKNKL